MFLLVFQTFLGPCFLFQTFFLCTSVISTAGYVSRIDHVLSSLGILSKSINELVSKRGPITFILQMRKLGSQELSNLPKITAKKEWSHKPGITDFNSQAHQQGAVSSFSSFPLFSHLLNVCSAHIYTTNPPRTI